MDLSIIDYIQKDILECVAQLKINKYESPRPPPKMYPKLQT